MVTTDAAVVKEDILYFVLHEGDCLGNASTMPCTQIVFLKDQSVVKYLFKQRDDKIAVFLALCKKFDCGAVHFIVFYVTFEIHLFKGLSHSLPPHKLSADFAKGL